MRIDFNMDPLDTFTGKHKDMPSLDGDAAWQTCRRLLSYIGPYIKYLIFGFIGFAIFAVCDSAFAWWMKSLVDSIASQRSDRSFFLASIIIVIFVARGMASLVGNYCTEYVARNLVNRIRTNLFSHLLELPFTFYEKNTSGSIVSKLIYNIETISGSSINSLRIVVRGGFTIIALLVFMVYINWGLSLLFFVAAPIMALIILVVTKQFRKISRKIQDEMGNVGDRSSEVIRGIQVVKVFAGQLYEVERFKEVIKNDLKSRIRLIMVKDISSTIVQFILAVTLSTLILISMQPAILADMTVGEFVSFVTAAGFISRPVMQLSQVNLVIQQGLTAAKSIFDVLDTEKEKDPGKKILAKCQGTIRFENVQFNYPDRTENVLKGIDFEIGAGETCALVGRSGSGKSTLAGLIARFYDVTAGRITLDGFNIRDISLADLRRHIALVSQTVSLFNGTIAENIAYGHIDKYGKQQIETAAEHAQVMEFAKNFPMGLDTPVGESGMLQSGGQRQRIAIARAFLKDAPILILDEATSALDRHSELQIQKAIQGLMIERTSLIIAHRLSTIENADKIIVLNKGQIADSGTHDQLISHDGPYRALYLSNSYL